MSVCLRDIFCCHEPGYNSVLFGWAIRAVQFWQANRVLFIVCTSCECSKAWIALFALVWEQLGGFNIYSAVCVSWNATLFRILPLSETVLVLGKLYLKCYVWLWIRKCELGGGQFRVNCIFNISLHVYLLPSWWTGLVSSFRLLEWD